METGKRNGQNGHLPLTIWFETPFTPNKKGVGPEQDTRFGDRQRLPRPCPPHCSMLPGRKPPTFRQTVCFMEQQLDVVILNHVLSDENTGNYPNTSECLNLGNTQISSTQSPLMFCSSKIAIQRKKSGPRYDGSLGSNNQPVVNVPRLLGAAHKPRQGHPFDGFLGTMAVRADFTVAPELGPLRSCRHPTS